MAFLPADQRELFLPLVEGLHESPPWGTFMRNLLARTNARRAFLIIALANAMPTQEPTVLQFTAPRAANEPPLDFRRIVALRLYPYGHLRPERVYSLEDVLDYDDPAHLVEQRASLDDMAIRYGRWLRISAGAADAWIFLVREREDFTATAVATLSGIAPHLAAALRAQVTLGERVLQARLAQHTLARIGVGEVALDRDGRVMAADPEAEAMLSIAEDPSGRPGRRLQLLPETARQVDEACAAIAASSAALTRVVLLDDAAGLFMLLRRADLTLPSPSAIPAVIGIVRRRVPQDSRSAIAVIAAIHGLSSREAALAYGLTQGRTIVEAGTRLRLTTETARNYSKKIYAKTGARGQADLVRILLGGLSPFC